MSFIERNKLNHELLSSFESRRNGSRVACGSGRGACLRLLICRAMTNNDNKQQATFSFQQLPPTVSRCLRYYCTKVPAMWMRWMAQDIWHAIKYIQARVLDATAQACGFDVVSTVPLSALLSASWA